MADVVNSNSRHAPQYIDEPDHEDTFWRDLSCNVAINILLVIFILPLMYTLIAMAKIADYISRRRLRKRLDAAIQEPAKHRPRRAF